MAKNDAILIARLQRFYGGEPLAWWDMPALRLKGFIDAMPAIIADERGALITDTAVGTGNVKKGFAAKHINQIRRDAAKGGGKQRLPQGKMKNATLEAMGIEAVNG